MPWDEVRGTPGDPLTFLVSGDNLPNLDMLDFGDALVAGTDDPDLPVLDRESSLALYHSLKDNLDKDDAVYPEAGSPPAASSHQDNDDAVSLPRSPSTTACWRLVALRSWTTDDVPDQVIAQRGYHAGGLGGRQSAKVLSAEGFRDVTVARFQEELVLHPPEAGDAWRWKGLFYFVLALHAKTFHLFFVHPKPEALNPTAWSVTRSHRSGGPTVYALWSS